MNSLHKWPVMWKAGNVETLSWITCDGSFTSYSSDVIMGSIASLITSITIVYSIVYSGADQRKHQSSASLAFVRGIRRGPVTSPHKWPVTWKMFPFEDVILIFKYIYQYSHTFVLNIKTAAKHKLENKTKKQKLIYAYVWNYYIALYEIVIREL